jgi:hypothetical protein
MSLLITSISGIRDTSLFLIKYNSRLEVVCFAQEEFDRDGEALVRLIKKEGMKLI